MNTLSYATRSIRPQEVTHTWWIIDASHNIPLGRLASDIAKYLRGKHKPSFTPHVNCGDIVIVTNAKEVRLTGKKLTQKKYISHTGYPGGQKITTPDRILNKDPRQLIEHAVKGMLPKNRLGKEIFRKNLYVYNDAKHPHAAQQPRSLNLT